MLCLSQAAVLCYAKASVNAQVWLRRAASSCVNKSQQRLFLFLFMFLLLCLSSIALLVLQSHFFLFVAAALA
jgi:hypothetical protein